ncbi:9037_t:CDS:2 [Entrophospora sp. SA101]|nr:9037_t:CDS:2 [Entrophospora sp. SA101]
MRSSSSWNERRIKICLVSNDSKFASGSSLSVRLTVPDAMELLVRLVLSLAVVNDEQLHSEHPSCILTF